MKVICRKKENPRFRSFSGSTGSFYTRSFKTRAGHGSVTSIRYLCGSAGQLTPVSVPIGVPACSIRSENPVNICTFLLLSFISSGTATAIYSVSFSPGSRLKVMLSAPASNVSIRCRCLCGIHISRVRVRRCVRARLTARGQSQKYCSNQKRCTFPFHFFSFFPSYSQICYPMLTVNSSPPIRMTSPFEIRVSTPASST